MVPPLEPTLEHGDRDRKGGGAEWSGATSVASAPPLKAVPTTLAGYSGQAGIVDASFTGQVPRSWSLLLRHSIAAIVDIGGFSAETLPFVNVFAVGAEWRIVAYCDALLEDVAIATR